MNNFTPWASLVGGVLIGISASLLLWLSGRTAGISGIVGGLVCPQRGDIAWRWLFIAGLIAGGILMRLWNPEYFASSPRSLGIVLLAGLLVGIGTRLGNGCTSGHGVCGLSRGSSRSLVATLCFMATGMVTATLMHQLGGL